MLGAALDAGAPVVEVAAVVVGVEEEVQAAIPIIRAVIITRTRVNIRQLNLISLIQNLLPG